MASGLGASCRREPEPLLDTQATFFSGGGRGKRHQGRSGQRKPAATKAASQDVAFFAATAFLLNQLVSVNCWSDISDGRRLMASATMRPLPSASVHPSAPCPQ